MSISNVKIYHAYTDFYNRIKKNKTISKIHKKYIFDKIGDPETLYNNLEKIKTTKK